MLSRREEKSSINQWVSKKKLHSSVELLKRVQSKKGYKKKKLNQSLDSGYIKKKKLNQSLDSGYIKKRN